MSWFIRLFRPLRPQNRQRPPDTGEPVFLAAPPPRPPRQQRQRAAALPLLLHATGCR